MKDSEGVKFLQWCLPQLRMRWPGFRKVRRQVYKRLDRRFKELGVPDVLAYRHVLQNQPSEWEVLDALCRIPISRFFRDKGVFQFLERSVMPHVAKMATAKDDPEVRCWSIGCASGEEPYTLTILWRLRVANRFPALSLRIVATDVDLQAIDRARRACYPASSIKDVPDEWREKAFVPIKDGFGLKEEYRSLVTFLGQDIRMEIPEEVFHLVLCRNVAFTYFDDVLQQKTLLTIKDRLLPGGILVIGNMEALPVGMAGYEPWSKQFGVYRTTETP